MITLTSNLSGATRRATLHGRDYVVAPLTLIVPGVLHGSRGPLYYPPTMTCKSARQWNGMPILAEHPTGGRSADNPRVLKNQQIGQVLGVQCRSGGALTGEGWFDVERTEQIDARILENLMANRRMEVSTGLFPEERDEEGTYDGIHFRAVVEAMTPDHVAVLMDQRGACSIADGCGVFAPGATLNAFDAREIRAGLAAAHELRLLAANRVQPVQTLKERLTYVPPPGEL